MTIKNMIIQENKKFNNYLENAEIWDEMCCRQKNLSYFVDDFGYYYAQNERVGMVESLRIPLLMMIRKKVVDVDLEADDWQSMWKSLRMQPVTVGCDSYYLVDNDAVDDDKEDLEWMGFVLHVKLL